MLASLFSTVQEADGFKIIIIIIAIIAHTRPYCEADKGFKHNRSQLSVDNIAHHNAAFVDYRFRDTNCFRSKMLVSTTLT